MVEMVIGILLGWKTVFAQERTTRRAIRQALTSTCVLGRRTIARSVLSREAEPEATRFDYCAEYKLHSRAPVTTQDMFTPMLAAALTHCPGRLLALAADDTRLRKTGKRIAGAHYGRDALSPPFHVNLVRGLRMLHACILVPLHATDGISARAIPVWFEQVTPVRKPGKSATDEERSVYGKAIKEQNLPTSTVSMMTQMRVRVDEAGGVDKQIVFGVDASMTNRTTFRADLERTHLIGRVRKDAVLCRKAEAGTRRVYAPETFTPDGVRVDESIAWHKARIFHGGKWREVEYKEVGPVLWRGGSGRRPVRLLVVKPVPYRLTKNGRLFYRQPAFLLTTSLDEKADDLLQIYFDRWQIEVAHREIKDTFGVGEAQVRNATAVARQPAFAVATYAALHVAALGVFGARRPDDLGPLPKWQREKARPSCQELIRYFRAEVLAKPDLLLPFGLRITHQSLLAASTA